MKVNVLKPIGYCNGVRNAFKIIENIRISNPNSKIYVLGMIIHNEIIVDILAKFNIETVNISRMGDPNDFFSKLTSSDIVVFTAHGQNKDYTEILKKKKITYYSTTCPFIKQIHKDIKDAIKKNHQVIFIGDNAHDETISIRSLAKKNLFIFDTMNQTAFDYSQIKDLRPIIFNQSTLNKLSLPFIHSLIFNNLPNAIVKDTVCNSSEIRQENILKDNSKPDLFLVIGSRLSNNTMKLYDIAKAKYKRVEIVNSLKDLMKINIDGVHEVTVSSGTSAAEISINEILDYLQSID